MIEAERSAKLIEAEAGTETETETENEDRAAPAGPFPSDEGVAPAADTSALLPGRYYDNGAEVDGPGEDDVVLLAGSSEMYRELMCSLFKSLRKRPKETDLQEAAATAARELMTGGEGGGGRRVFAPVIRGESGSGVGGICFVRVVDDGGIVARECKGIRYGIVHRKEQVPCLNDAS